MAEDRRTPPLQKAIERAATGVIETQEVFDRAYARELEVYEDMLRAAPAGPLGDVVRGMASLRQRVAESELEFSVRIDVERTRGFEIQARVLNLGYTHRYGVTASDASRIRVTVLQVPLQKEDADAEDQQEDQ